MRLAGMLGAVLAVCVLGASPAAAAEDALSPGQQRAVEEVVRDYLRRNPEVLLEAIEAMRAKRDAEQQATVRKNLVSLRGDLENDPTSPVGGNPRGDVTIVEFFDYQCPYCKRVFPAVQTLLKTDGNIRYVFKEFPILGPQSVVAARAALAAWKLDRDRYVPFHAALMQSTGRPNERSWTSRRKAASTWSGCAPPWPIPGSTRSWQGTPNWPGPWTSTAHRPSSSARMWSPAPSTWTR